VIDNKKVLVLIPARGGSKGLPRKNIRDLCGKPLIGWPIEAARNSIYVDKIIVSTEDGEIAEKAIALGAEVPFIRPIELASDTASSFDVIKHALTYLEKINDRYDYLVLLEATSPTTEASDIDKALEILVQSRNIADSIVGVAKLEGTHPSFNVHIDGSGLLKPFISADFVSVGRRQDLTDLYYFEGSVYISDVTALLEQKSFYHNRTLPYVVPKWKSFEIDDIVDFVCIESILNKMDLVKER
jgi:N-acylneuraminate cytidylyltransferase/CMP-N,N'-diacetyllegionaminic acid synthase